ADDHLAAFAAYQISCQALRKTRQTGGKPLAGALWNVCRKAVGFRPQHSNTARNFFEQNFQPVRIARLGETQGFLTGYYEPVVQGSRFPSPEFHVPLYRRPPDLVAVGYKSGSKAFPNKGTRIAAVTSKTNWCRTTTVALLRPGPSMARNLKSAGSRIHSICSRSRLKARGG